MTDQTATPVDANEPTRLKKNFFQTLELDTRLLGMIGAFVVIALIFNVLTEGRFLTPRNIFNLTIQTVSVAIMATGMVFVIVMRHIDLSVGAVLAVTSAMMAMTQVMVMPQWLGVSLGSPLIAPVAIVVGLLTGVAVGALHGWLIGYLTIPAFIVTLGGYLIWRNVAWYLTNGQTIGPLDETFQIFGGINGTLGETWSWVFGALAVAATIWAMIRARRLKIAHEFPVKPVWAEALLGTIGTAAILGFVWILNSYDIPKARLARMFADRDATADNLDVVLDLIDSQITYRSRYLVGVALAPVRDMALLDPNNPRSVAFQVQRISEHLAGLPTLRHDGMLEAPQRIARLLDADLSTAEAGKLDNAKILGFEQSLMSLAVAIEARYFLQGSNAVRAETPRGLA